MTKAERLELKRKINIVKGDLNAECIDYEIGVDSGSIYLNCCAIGNNFYDYGDSMPKEWDWSNIPSYAKKHIESCKSKVVIVPCENCCGCMGW